jgi:hypothetical protein
LLLFFLTLTTSCKTSSVFGIREKCQMLGETGICSDKRLTEPPALCLGLNDELYECPSEYFVGYTCTNADDYNALATTCEDLAQENRELKRRLRRCR